MPTTFSRSLRSLSFDGFRRANFAVFVVIILLIVWLLWLVLARVTLYEASANARLEVESAVHQVAVQFGGRVVATRLQLGAEVQAGDVLIELDTEEHKLHLEEQKSKLSAFQNQLSALRNEVAAQERSARQEETSGQTLLEEAQARNREAEAAAKLNEQESARMAELFKRGLVSEAEFRRAETNATRTRAAAEALRLSVNRSQTEQKTKASDQQAKLERLHGEVAALEGQIAGAEKAIAQEQLEIQEQYIRAPISGRIGEISEIQIGSVVQPGDKLAAIVPSGEVRIVAHYQIGRALGRIHSGQAARMRLDAYPWTQYGTVPAQVRNVASEPHEGRFRVEFTVPPHPQRAFLLQHGLTGTVEVEVDRVAPAAMILQTVSELVGSSKTR